MNANDNTSNPTTLYNKETNTYEYRCALCGIDKVGKPFPIGKFDFEGEGTCFHCYEDYVLPCDRTPERNKPVYSPLGVGMTDGDHTSLIINERWNYKVKLICVSMDTRPLEKLVNKYNDDLEAVASAEGFDITPNVDLEMGQLICKKIADLVDILGKRDKLPKNIVLTEKNIKTFKKQLAELKATRGL
tara:strand:- start:232 stop:795 length:564 start_codon:yes stop_codon:yes gene_type:complete